MLKPRIPKIVRRKRKVTVGAVPGTLVAPAEARPPVMRMIAYGEQDLVENEISDPSELLPYLKTHPVVWLDVVGLGDTELLTTIGEILGLHRLALEDVLNTNHRSKVEQFGDVDFLIARMASREAGLLDLEQVSLFLGRKTEGETKYGGFVVSFQERAGDCFEPVRERIREARGRIRRVGPDYLAYALLDAMVDAAYPVVEEIGDELEVLDALILEEADPELANRVHGVKRELLTLRRALWPLREAIHTWLREEGELLQEDTIPYIRDCADHVVQLVDYVESNRELCNALSDLHDSRMNNRLNEVMKVLTIMSSIFIPLGFLAGLYGMNFNPELDGNMPETQWRFGYVYVLALMATIAVGMVAYFRRKKWI